MHQESRVIWPSFVTKIFPVLGWREKRWEKRRKEGWEKGRKERWEKGRIKGRNRKGRKTREERTRANLPNVGKPS